MAQPNVVHIDDTHPGTHQYGSDVRSDGFAREIDDEDERGHIDPAREIRRTARNAVEIAALLGFRRRSGRETETVPAGGTDELEHDDETTRRHDRRT